MASNLTPEQLERRRSRERMRYVEPQNCGKILAHDRYWTRQFLERYLERCVATIPESPFDAYLLGDPLDKLSARIRVGPGAGDYDTEEEKASYELRALATKAATCQAAPRLGHDEADVLFHRAFDHLKGQQLAPVAVAELQRRYAAHLAEAGDPAFHEHLERAIEISERHQDEAGYVDALLLRGTLREDAAAAIDLVQVLRLASLGTPRGKRAYAAALRRLTGTLLIHGKGLQPQETAALALNEAVDRLKGRSLCRRKACLYWIEGLLLRNLGVDRHADRKLVKARDSFRALREPLQLVLVSLDLAYLLVGGAEHERAAKLRTEDQQWVAEHSDDEALLAIVSAWDEASDLIELRERATALRSP